MNNKPEQKTPTNENSEMFRSEQKRRNPFQKLSVPLHSTSPNTNKPKPSKLDRKSVV